MYQKLRTGIAQLQKAIELERKRLETKYEAEEGTMPSLGMTVKDKITGFTGVITGYVAYLTGCNQCLVAPPVGKDGAFKDSQWFDEQRLIVDTSKKTVVLDNTKSVGFGKPAPKR